MNTKFPLVLITAALICAGCVSTVNERKTAAVPFVKDKIEGRYERSVGQVHEAAKAVLMDNGSLTRDTALLTSTNTVYALEGRVNQRDVWVRVEEIEPKITSVTVQARTKMGGTDIDLVHELEKQIAIRLTR